MLQKLKHYYCKSPYDSYVDGMLNPSSLSCISLIHDNSADKVLSGILKTWRKLKF